VQLRAGVYVAIERFGETSVARVGAGDVNAVRAADRSIVWRA
jgi:hypothetical protein